MMKKVNQNVENYGEALDAYLFYNKKALDDAGIYEMGMDDGKNEKAKETAKKMLKKGIPLEDIAYYTELSIDEIEDLKKEEI